jgi:hypothetical protein
MQLPNPPYHAALATQTLLTCQLLGQLGAVEHAVERQLGGVASLVPSPVSGHAERGFDWRGKASTSARCPLAHKHFGGPSGHLETVHRLCEIHFDVTVIWDVGTVSRLG